MGETALVMPDRPIVVGVVGVMGLSKTYGAVRAVDERAHRGAVSSGDTAPQRERRRHGGTPNRQWWPRAARRHGARDVTRGDRRPADDGDAPAQRPAERHARADGERVGRYKGRVRSGREGFAFKIVQPER